MSLWQTHTLDLHTGGKEKEAVLDRRLDACSVGIVNHHHLLGEAAYETNLVVGECRAAAADDILNAAAMERHDVELAFHEVGEVLAADGMASLIKSEEVAPLVEQRSLAGVDILAGVLLRRYLSAAEAYDTAVEVVEGEHQAVAEGVVKSAVLRTAQHADIHQHVLAVALLAHVVEKGVACRCIANAEVGQRALVGVAVASLREERPSLLHLRLEELGGRLDGNKLRLALLVACLLFRRCLLLLDVDVVFLGKEAQRLYERHILMFLEERDGVAMLAADEAMVGAARWRHHHRRVLVVVERTQTLVVDARLAQRDKLADDIDDVCRVAYLVDSFFINHSSNFVFSEDYGLPTRLHAILSFS